MVIGIWAVLYQSALDLCYAYDEYEIPGPMILQYT